MSAVDRVAISALLCASCAHVAPRAAAPGAYVDAKGTPVSEEGLRNRLRSVRFVLVGEAHDNICDHDQERRLVELATSSAPFVVGMEMLTFEQQPVLDDFMRGKTDLESLAAALDWRGTWGFPFDSYAPILAAARSAGAPLIGLNAPKSVIQQVRLNGLEGVPAATRSQVTPEIVPPPPEQEAMLREAMSHHHKPDQSSSDQMADWARFTRVQSFWDSQMAWRAAQAERSRGLPVLIIAGGGHVAHGWGIASRLRTFAPDATTLSIMPWRGGALDPSEADLFFACPQATGSDSAMVP